MIPKSWNNVIIHARLIFGVFLNAHVAILWPCGVWRILEVLTKCSDVQRCTWWPDLLPIFEQFQHNNIC
jgi:hypothetical protein